MNPEPESQAPGSRSAKLRIIAPIAIVVGGLVLFLALFWHPGGHGRKGRIQHGTAAGRDRSPVGGSGDESNTRVTEGSGGSPVGGGPSRARGGGKGDTWWYREGKTRRGATEDAWWAPKKDGQRDGDAGEASRDESPVGGGPSRSSGDRSGAAERDREDERPARGSDKPARASTTNPGETAGQKGGPDDFWWRN